MKNLTTFDEFLNEKAKPPKLDTKDRKANQVKAEATTKVLGPDSKNSSIVKKILKQVETEAKKIAKDRKVPIKDVKLDSVSLKSNK